MPPVRRRDGVRALPGYADPVLRVEVCELRRDRGPGRFQEPGAGPRDQEEGGWRMIAHLVVFLSVFIPLTATIPVCYPALSFPFRNRKGGGLYCPGITCSHSASGIPVDPGRSGSVAPPRWSWSPFSGSCSSF